MTTSIEDRVSELERRVSALEGVRSTQGGSASVAQSPREFLLSKAPKSDNDKTLAAGYYLEIIEGHEAFDFDDIEGFYSKAKEAAPKNRRDPPYQNVKRGYFREVGRREQHMHARNKWALTNLGIARVESGFSTKK